MKDEIAPAARLPDSSDFIPANVTGDGKTGSGDDALDFTLYSAVSKVLLVSGPIALAYLVEFFPDAVATAYLTDFGDDMVAAYGVCMLMYAFLVGSSMEFCTSGGILIGSCIGTANDRSVGVVLANTIYLVLLCSVPLELVMINAEPVLLLLGQDGAVSELTQNFCRAMCLGIPLDMVYHCVAQVYIATEKSHVVLVCSILKEALRALLLTQMVAGNGTLSSYTGVGVAFVIATFVGLVLLSTHLACYHRAMLNSASFSWALARRLLAIAWPYVMNSVAEVGSVLATVLIVGRLGSKELSAVRIAEMYFIPVVISYIAVADATCVLTECTLGAGQAERAFLFGKANVLVSFVIGVVVLVSAAVIPVHWLVALFDEEPAEGAEDLVRMFLLLMMAGVVLDAFRYPAVAALRAYDDLVPPVLESMLGIVVIGVSTSVALSYVDGLDNGAGPWLGRAIGMAIAALLVFPRWYKRAQREIEMPAVDYSEAAEINELLQAGLLEDAKTS